MKSQYIAMTKEDRQQMMETVGISAIDQLFADIPEDLRLKQLPDLGEPLSEWELIRYFRALARQNRSCADRICFLGAGAYDHFIPAVVDEVLSKQEFYTSYTPYQAEISQGMLQATFEYQTMICELTGMDVANASMYDGATATAEAALLACQATRRTKLVAAPGIHPQTLDVLKTYQALGRYELVELDERFPAAGSGQTVNHESNAPLAASDPAALIIQSPDFFGLLSDLQTAAEWAHQKGAYLIVITDPIALALFEPPGHLGADLVVGDGQVLGNPLNFGGPTLGFMAATKKDLRRLPGRMVGETVDRSGKRGFVLTMQTREQHIRREKATSNICSNQALNALAASVYLTAMGPAGLREVALQCLSKARYAYEQLIATDYFQPLFPDQPFFREFAVTSAADPDDLNRHLAKSGIMGGLPLKRLIPSQSNGWLLAVTEKRSREEIDALITAIARYKTC